jgi:hypothetical protein
MRSRLRVIIVLVVLAWNYGCGARLVDWTPAERRDELTIQRDRLARESDVVDRTKAYIRISRLLLTFASDAVAQGDSDALESNVDQYVATLETARDTIINSDRDPVRRPAGFKDLEIAIREDLRVLNDLTAELPFDGRAPLDNAITAATGIRESILAVLFPT